MLRKSFNKLPFVCLLPVFITGIVGYEYLSFLPVSFWICGLFFFFLLFLGLHLLKSINLLVHWGRMTSSLLCVLFFAGLLTFFSDIRQDKYWYGHFVKDVEAYLIEINSDVEEKERSYYFTATVLQSMGKHASNTHGDIKVYIYKNEDTLILPTQGSRLIITNKLANITGSGNPYSFDYSIYSQRKGYYHQVFLGKDDYRIVDLADSHKLGWMPRTKQHLLSAIRDNVKDEVTASLIEATLLNERSMLSDELWKAYADTGIVHIIAISGMHVSIMFSILLFMLAWIRNKKYEWVKYFIALPLVWFYILLTDYPASAVRAAVMFTFVAIGFKIAKSGNPLNTWAAAAFLMLAYEPNWLYDLGMQLSFLCILSIILYFGFIRQQFAFSTKIFTYLWDCIAVSIAVQILVFPLVMYYFHQFPFWVLIANIPAALYSFVLMAGALLLFALASLQIPCVWLGDTLILFTEMFHQIIGFFANITPSVLKNIYLDATDWLLLTITSIVFTLYFMKPASHRLLMASVSLMLFLGSRLIQDYHHKHQHHVIVYNVSRKTAIDVMEAERVFNIGDTLSEKELQYNLLPARIALRIQTKYLYNIDQNTERKDTFLHIGNKRIVVLRTPFYAGSKLKFKTDYLVIGKEQLFQPYEWYDVFEPKKIILDGSVNRTKSLQWKKKLEDFNINVEVHSVATDGAWAISY